MSKPELTKLMIADTLKTLVLTIHIDKITIHDIVEACGINRKTFYYHFQDKQSLISWIFNEDFAKYDDESTNGEILKSIVTHMYDNKAFYVPAILSEVQNNLRAHIFALAQDRCLKEIKVILGTRQMSEHNCYFLANYFANAVVGSIIQWAQEGMKSNPTELNMDIAPITSDCMKLVINQYASPLES